MVTILTKYYYYNGQLYSQEELTHFGVKGMKWGIRRKRNNPSTGKSRNSSGKSEEELKAKAERSAARKEKVSSAISAGKEFMKRNGPTIAAAVASTAAAALGFGYLNSVINAANTVATREANSRAIRLTEATSQAEHERNRELTRMSQEAAKNNATSINRRAMSSVTSAARDAASPINNTIKQLNEMEAVKTSSAGQATIDKAFADAARGEATTEQLRMLREYYNK